MSSSADLYQFKLLGAFCGFIVFLADRKHYPKSRDNVLTFSASRKSFSALMPTQISIDFCFMLRPDFAPAGCYIIGVKCFKLTIQSIAWIFDWAEIPKDACSALFFGAVVV